jgi:hypothetical protein
MRYTTVYFYTRTACTLCSCPCCTLQGATSLLCTIHLLLTQIYFCVRRVAAAVEPAASLATCRDFYQCEHCSVIISALSKLLLLSVVKHNRLVSASTTPIRAASARYVLQLNRLTVKICEFTATAAAALALHVAKLCVHSHSHVCTTAVALTVQLICVKCTLCCLLRACTLQAQLATVLTALHTLCLMVSSSCF